MFATRLLQLLIGLFLFGFAMGMIVRAAIGVEPWNALSLGIEAHTGIPFGVLTNAIGALILLLWIPLRQSPGLGTVLNVLMLGPAAEFALAVVPHPAQWWWQALLFTAGLALLGISGGLYIGAGFGPGPRDGLMLGLNQRFGWPIWAARTGIELVVLTGGWLLGGNLGIGTIAFALLIGPMLQYTVPLFTVRPNALVPREGALA
jgi:uncharacterized membrane protein YczE